MSGIEQKLVAEAKQSREALSGIAQRLDEETSARQGQMMSFDNMSKNITERLSKLEMGATEGSRNENLQPNINMKGGLTPAHVI